MFLPSGERVTLVTSGMLAKASTGSSCGVEGVANEGCATSKASNSANALEKELKSVSLNIQTKLLF